MAEAAGGGGPDHEGDTVAAGARMGAGTPPKDLADRLRLEAHAEGGFASRPQNNDSHIFGGLLMSQALQAATFTVSAGLVAHSVHGSFLDGGDGRVQLRYHVEETRDGASFSARRVVAEQSGLPLFVATVSFHAPEPGPDYEGPAAGPVPPPDALPPGRYDTPWFESRDVPMMATGSIMPFTRRAWFRARHRLPDDAALHAQALVYLTDHGATRAVRQPHADHPGVEQRMSVSLDHTVWLHRPVRVDQWLLSEFYPVATGAGRGLALGSVRTAEGRLVATVAQEALLRFP
jgi:acyl-CoA thioesterase II